MLRGQEERKYSIRKYSIGVVSVLAATMFIVSSHEAQASEKTPTSNAAAQKRNTKSTGRTREYDNVTSNAVRKAIRRYA